MPSATLDYAAISPTLRRIHSLLIAIHSRGPHLCRCIRACDCLVPHQYVGGRIHVAVTSILPNQSARNLDMTSPTTIREVPYGLVYYSTNFSKGGDIQGGDQLGRRNQFTRESPVHSLFAFLTISTFPPMHSSPSLSRSIAVWKVNLEVVRIMRQRGPRNSEMTLTLTSPCQSARMAFPARKVARIRGTFLIPPN